MQVTAGRLVVLVVLLAHALVGAGCAARLLDRVVYEERGVRIGIEQDPSAGKGGSNSYNNHPARLMPDEVRKLLSPLQVSGYTGVLVGQLLSASPLPVFTNEELQLITGPISTALAQAGPRDRIFFSIPSLASPYRTEHTAGALFLRGPYLHLVLTDHSAITKTDQAGGEDPRDMKGMKLFVSSPWKAATLPASEVPRWGPYERVTIAVDARQMLAAAAPAVEPAPRPSAPPALPQPQPAQPAPVAATVPMEPQDPLGRQLRDLAAANQALKTQLDEQSKQMDALRQELDRLKADLAKGGRKSKSKPNPPPR